MAEVISIRIPKDLKNQLNYASNTAGITRSDYIRKLIENSIYKRNTGNNTVLLYVLLGTTTILTTILIKAYFNNRKLHK